MLDASIMVEQVSASLYMALSRHIVNLNMLSHHFSFRINPHNFANIKQKS